MIDLKLIRENPELVKENIKKKFQNEKLVDEVIQFDEEWRKLKGQEDALRSERNKISEEINKLKKEGKDVSSVVKKAKDIPVKIQESESRRKELEEKIKQHMLKIPNIMHASVPIGKDASENVEVRKWGKPKKPKFELLNHAELIENMGYADFDAGRSNAGQGFNYLMGQMALLDNALQRYGVDFLREKGFKLVVPPLTLNFETLLGALNGLEDFEQVVYKIDNEDLYLIGTAEHALVSLLKNKVLQELPMKFCAVTPCFRKEIGAHGVDTKGLFRMHQFNKVEQVVFSNPENSFKMLEEMQKITEAFIKSLGIPYRVIEICSGDLGAKFAKQYDIEAWFPRQDNYAEITSAGSCTDFQARALNIRYQKGNDKEYVHILNNTMVATSRVMVAILENFQQKDGSVKVPKALVKYMGIKKISPQ
ncbi:serine--tRNA ligase [Candidatus Woesearchaeota archaeon]|nr:MAG: serine--tRNA ligase [Candidatus Woesearchaeota archaeon]